MMWRTCLIVGVLLALVSTAGSAWAFGGASPCQQSELQGTWDIHIGVGGTDCPGDYSLEGLQVQIDANGMIQATGATLQSRCGSQTVTGGQLTLLSTCVIEGSIETSAGTLNVERGGTAGEGKLVLDTAQE